MTSITIDSISIVRNLLRWWRGEIAGMLRDIARRGVRHTAVYTVEPDGNIQFDKQESQQAVAQEACLHIADRCFLRKKIVLPQSASRKLASILYYEFSRYFPLEQDSVIYSYTEPVIKNNNLETEVWAIQKQSVINLLDDIYDRTGKAYKYVSVQNASGNICIDYSNQVNSGRLSVDSLSRSRAFLVAVCLLIFLTLLPPVKLALFNYSITDDIRKKKEELRQTILMHEEMIQAEQKIANIIEEKDPSASLIATISSLTEVIEGQAVIKALSLDGKAVKITGTSADIERLTALLKSVAATDSLKIHSGRNLLKNVPFEASFIYERK